MWERFKTGYGEQDIYICEVGLCRLLIDVGYAMRCKVVSQISCYPKVV